MKWIGETPVTQSGLRQYDGLPAAVAVAKAWSVPGRMPACHRRAQATVRRIMPVLARALDRLSQEIPE